MMFIQSLSKDAEVSFNTRLGPRLQRFPQYPHWCLVKELSSICLEAADVGDDSLFNCLVSPEQKYLMLVQNSSPLKRLTTEASLTEGVLRNDIIRSLREKPPADPVVAL